MNNFSFPPPPPPPSKTPVGQQSQAYDDLHHRGSRGRGSSQGQRHSTGSQLGAQAQRQQPATRTDTRYQAPPWQSGNYNYTNERQHVQHGHGTSHNHSSSSSTRSDGPNRTAAGHKRKLDALRGPQAPQVTKAGPEIAPAVPSFGAPLFPVNAVAKQKPGDSQSQPTINKRSLFGAGITQVEPAYSDSDHDDEQEDDAADEEAMYAELGNKLMFEYDGKVVSLTSEADLARWQEERRQKWPTNSRIAEKDAQRYAIGEERRRLLRGAYALRRADWQVVLLRQSADRLAADDVPAAIGTASGSEQQSNSLLGMTMYDSDDDEAIQDDSKTASQPNADPTALDVESDEAPEQVSSKASHQEARPACRFFFKTGKCKAGNSCDMRHEALPGQPFEKPKRVKPRVVPKRGDNKKGIHQLLLDQENTASDLLALKVIKHLGSIGFFKDVP